MSTVRTLEEMEREDQRAFLRKHKKPIGARRALGKRYIDPRDLPAMGASLEKRGRKALKRLEQLRRAEAAAQKRAARERP